MTEKQKTERELGIKLSRNKRDIKRDRQTDKGWRGEDLRGFFFLESAIKSYLLRESSQSCKEVPYGEEKKTVPRDEI